MQELEITGSDGKIIKYYLLNPTNDYNPGIDPKTFSIDLKNGFDNTGLDLLTQLENIYKSLPNRPKITGIGVMKQIDSKYKHYHIKNNYK